MKGKPGTDISFSGRVMVELGSAHKVHGEAALEIHGRRQAASNNVINMLRVCCLSSDFSSFPCSFLCFVINLHTVFRSRVLLYYCSEATDGLFPTQVGWCLEICARKAALFGFYFLSYEGKDQTFLISLELFGLTPTACGYRGGGCLQT